MNTLDPVVDSDLFDELDLTCPSCDADLIRDELFASHRVCSNCGRHFPLSARERISLIVDADSFDEMRVELVTPDLGLGNDQMLAAERLAELRHLQVIGDAVVTGVGRISGLPVLVVALDDYLVGAMLGATMTEKIILALEQAVTRKLPVVVVCSGSPGADQAGQLAMVQGGRLASAFAQLHLARMPTIGVLTNGVAASVYSVLAANCDVIFAEPGVHFGRPGSSSGSDGGARRQSHDSSLLDAGWIDGSVERSRLRGRIGHILDLLSNPGVSRPKGSGSTRGTNRTKPQVALELARHPDRPNADFYLEAVFSGMVELRGDRLTGDSSTVKCGLARVESITVAVAAVRAESGSADEEALATRKIARLARFAGRMELPLVLLASGDPLLQVDREPNPGVSFGASALQSMLAVLPTPIISICPSVASGPLAMTLISGDRFFMLSNAVLLGKSAEGSGMPLPVRMQGAAGSSGLLLTAHDCERLGLVDGVIGEPAAGAHTDPEGTAEAIESTLSHALAELTGTGQRRLLDTRFRRQRTLGQSTPEGLAAARSELWEIQEWQRSVTQSIDDLRERWDQIRASSPRVSFHRPEMPDLAVRFRARRDELLERRRHQDRDSDS